MRLLTLSLALALATTSLLLAQNQVSANDDAAAKAQAILAKARQALGSEAKLKALQSLTINGKMRRVMGERDMSGEVQFDILLPDYGMKIETLSPVPGVEMTTTDALNGAEVWSDQNTGHSGGANIIIRRPGVNTPQGQEMAKQMARADLTRFWLGLLLTAPTSSNVSFNYAGEAEAPDGKADVLDVKSAGGSTSRLFLDQKTHRVLMLTYQGRRPRVVVNNAGGPPTEEELQKRIKEAEAQAAAQPPVEFQMRFSDYSEEGGIAFPHRITRGINDEVTEELELTKFKLNPPLKPEKFAKK
jgi:hypothetical protein